VIYMFVVQDTENFKKAFEQMSYFIDDCNIHTNDEGLTIKAFDNTQMLFLEYSLPKKMILGDLDSGVFGINISEFNKILSKIGNNENLSFYLEENQLALKVKGIYERTYFFPLKDLDEKEFRINKKDYDVSISLNAGILKDIFYSAKTVADAIVFDCNFKDIKLVAEGIYGKYATMIKPIQGNDCKTKFSANYLYNMIRSIDANVNVEIKLNSQLPLYLSYKLGENKLGFFLAHMYI